MLEVLPEMQPAEANRHAAEADYLLLVDFTLFSPGLQIPAKLYTYLRLGRPVLALTTPGSPVEKILEQSGVPYRCLYPSSPAEQIDREVLEFLSLPSTPVRASEWFWNTFDGATQTGLLASVLDGLKPAGE